MKYFGNILVGDGMIFCEIKRGDCRHRLNKELREIAMGNRQPRTIGLMVCAGFEGTHGVRGPVHT